MIVYVGASGCVDKRIIPFNFCPHPLAGNPAAEGILCKAMQEGLKGVRLKGGKNRNSLIEILYLESITKT